MDRKWALRRVLDLETLASCQRELRRRQRRVRDDERREPVERLQVDVERQKDVPGFRCRQPSDDKHGRGSGTWKVRSMLKNLLWLQLSTGCFVKMGSLGNFADFLYLNVAIFPSQAHPIYDRKKFIRLATGLDEIYAKG